MKHFTKVLNLLLVVAFAAFLIANTHKTITFGAPPAHISTEPTWDIGDAQQFKGCTATGAKWIPRSVVVETRSGDVRKVLPFNDATVAHINATWNNEDGRDDLFTTGACR